MADLSHVETALVDAVIARLYPNGMAGSTICGVPVRVYRGWPISGALNVDLQAGTSNVSVFAVPGSTRNTTRWAKVAATTVGAVTMTAQTNGNSVTFDGTASFGQVAGLMVDGQTFAYRIQSGDTSSLVAAVLAEAVRAMRTCWLSDNTVTIPGAYRVTGRIVADAETTSEWARQTQDFRISAWCPNPTVRDNICSLIGSALATTAFIALSDASAARLRYRSTSSIDDGQDAGLYRRDLFYDVEYGTSIVEVSPTMLFGELGYDGATVFA